MLGTDQVAGEATVAIPTAHPGPSPRTAWSLPVQALVLTGCRLVVGVLLAALAVTSAHVGSAPGVGGRRTLAGSLLHWDAVWYQQIANGGYPSTIPARTSFFPLYPSVLHVLSLLHLSTGTVGLGVSWISFFFASWAVLEISRSLFPEADPFRAGLLLAWFPMSVFLLSGYAEALMGALAGWSFVFVARHRWVMASVLAAAASATRPEGALVATAAVTALLLAHRYRSALVAAVMGTSGVAGFSVFCWFRYGHPFEYVRVQRHWFRSTTVPFVGIPRDLRAIAHWPHGETDYLVEVLVEDVLLLAALVGVVYFFRLARQRAGLRPFLPYLMGCLLLASSSLRMGLFPDGSGRVLMSMLPLLALAGRLRSSSWRSVLALSVGSAVLLQTLFNVGGHVV